MVETEDLPWSFTVTFDEKKAQKNGYTTDELYDYVNESISQYDVERLSYNKWHARLGQEDQLFAQYRALEELSKDPVVMKNISSITFFEEERIPFNLIEILRRHNPERIYG